MKPQDEKKSHIHPAYFSSELACKICNPICWKNHQFSMETRFEDCGVKNCPNHNDKIKQRGEIIPFTPSQYAKEAVSEIGDLIELEEDTAGFIEEVIEKKIKQAIQKTRYDCEKKHLENDIWRVETNPAIPEDKKREIVKEYKEDFDKKFGVYNPDNTGCIKGKIQRGVK